MYPVVTVLREHALPGSEVNPSLRPIDCFESWVTYLARCARQHRFREAPPIWAGDTHNLFVDAAGWLMTWGKSFAVPPGHADSIHSDPTPVAGMAGVRVRSLATGALHNIALGWDGRVYWWGTNPSNGMLLSPVPVEGVKGVCGIVSAFAHSLGVTESGAVFGWISAPQIGVGMATPSAGRR